MPRGDHLQFLRALLRNPTRVGAVAPSGRALAKLITANLGADHLPVIELGPGTGAFTAAMIAGGLPEHHLALIERDPTFAATLSRRFPRALVLAMDASSLASHAPLFDQPVGAVVSGLPLVSLPEETVEAVLRGVFHHVRRGGALFQFTYLPRCPLSARLMRELQLDAERVGSAWANLPPAFVYRITRSLDPL